MSEVWENVKRFYKEKFDIEPEIVDLYCDYSVLLMCATGASNQSIANFLGMERKEVAAIVNKYFDIFYGWGEDLSTNPLKMYRDGELIDYLELKVCEKFVELEKLLDEKWV